MTVYERHVSWEDFQREVLTAAVSMTPTDFETKYGRTLNIVSTHNSERAAWVKQTRQFLQVDRSYSFAPLPAPPLECMFHGPINSGSSCYMDSVLVAIFVPFYDAFFNNALLSPVLDWGQMTAWEEVQDVSPKWRESVRCALTTEVVKLRDVDRKGSWSLGPFRSLFRECKFAVPNEFGIMQTVDFSGSHQQSAVDFMRYLFHVLGLRDRVCFHRHSTTLFDHRPEVVSDPSLRGLSNLWTRYIDTVQDFTPETAGELHDLDEAAVLHASPKGTIFQLNSQGDRRRITALEHTATFLCQMTSEDEREEAVSVSRDIVPHVELMQVDEHYRGRLHAKMHANYLDTEETRVLIFEVSRSIGNRKVNTRVDFGERRDTGWVLHLENRQFKLSAVVCHQGSVSMGHYVSFVAVNMETGGDQWCIYDDNTGRGDEIDPDTMERHDFNPARCGEIFLYTLLENQ